MVRRAIGLAILATTGVPIAWADQVVVPEITMPVVLSNTDVNRITCTNGVISDVFFSEEKGVKVSHKGSNAFLKFTIRTLAGKEEHVSAPAEFYVVCDGEVYTMVSQPKPGPAMTVRLSSPMKNKMQSNIDLFQAMAEEERIQYITQAIYKDELPDSFTVTKSEFFSLALYAELEIRRVRTIRAEGVGYRASEYQIKAKKPVDLVETAFLRNEFGTDIAGITMDPPHLDAGATARLIVVERGVTQ